MIFPLMIIVIKDHETYARWFALGIIVTLILLGIYQAITPLLRLRDGIVILYGLYPGGAKLIRSDDILRVQIGSRRNWFDGARSVTIVCSSRTYKWSIPLVYSRREKEIREFFDSVRATGIKE